MPEETPNMPRVLVITPHPDDAEGGAGATIAKWADQGSWIGLVVCTNGDKGTSDPEMKPEHMAEIREAEQLAAAKILGIKHVSFLGFPDQGLEDNDIFREKLVREIRTHRPEIVITIDPSRPYIIHRDHRLTGRVALDAIYPYSRDHMAYPQHAADGLRPHKVKEIYLWGTDHPDTYIDVSETFERKLDALFAHRSQMGDPADQTRRNRSRARYEAAGKNIGASLAESFKRVELSR